MTTSGVGAINQECYELTGGESGQLVRDWILTLPPGCYDIYGFEYAPGADGFITWVSEGKASWTVNGPGLGPDPETEIGQRPIPQEPMASKF